VPRIGTCKLNLWDGRILHLHDVLYTLEVRWNLVSIHALLQLGFNIAFVVCCVKIYLDNIFYGSGFVLNGFMVLDIVIYLLMMMLLFMLFKIPTLLILVIS
jgi:polysaccharide pyruvyl transferase WcaK-like protein